MQDQTNTKGFTTTFLSLGSNAIRLNRGERVRIVCKTKHQARASASDGIPQEHTKASKKKAPKKAAAAKKSTITDKTRKVTKKRRKAHAKDAVEELSDDYDDDAVGVAAPTSTTVEYPLIPESTSSKRCVSFSNYP